MFERFTEKARRVIVLAAEEARLLNHAHIDTEHLLLGLIRQEDSIAGKALLASGVGREAAYAAVEKLVESHPAPPPDHIPLTPEAKEVMEQSLRESLELGSTSIDTGHLLLGLIREGEGVANAVLHELGADGDTLRKETLERMGALAAAGARSPDCPRCGADLMKTIACREVSIPAADGGNLRAASMVYCTECGMTLGVLPSADA